MRFYNTVHQHYCGIDGDLTAPIQNTVSQYNLPALGAWAGRKKERADIPSHFPDPVVRQMVELELTLCRAWPARYYLPAHSVHR
jgi:hypothetical protein